MSLEALIYDEPFLLGHFLPSGRMIAEGADNAMHCMCYTCNEKVAEPVTAVVVQSSSPFTLSICIARIRLVIHVNNK
jgi:hypothetical protein